LGECRQKKRIAVMAITLIARTKKANATEEDKKKELKNRRKEKGGVLTLCVLAGGKRNKYSPKAQTL